jgi:hypothetical protein
MEFMPPDERKDLYRHQKVISEGNKYTFVITLAHEDIGILDHHFPHSTV